MNGDEREHQIFKRRFMVTAGLMLLLLATTTTIADILDTNQSDSPLVGALIIPSMPGFIIYVLHPAIYIVGSRDR